MEPESRTVLKTTYGQYNYLLGDDFGEIYNENARTTVRYRWRDLDGNGKYTPGETNLDLDGLDFLAISGARNSILNPASEAADDDRGRRPVSSAS